LDGGSAHVKPIRTQDNTERRGHTSMSRSGLEPTISVFEQSLGPAPDVTRWWYGWEMPHSWERREIHAQF